MPTEAEQRQKLKDYLAQLGAESAGMPVHTITDNATGKDIEGVIDMDDGGQYVSSIRVGPTRAGRRPSPSASTRAGPRPRC
jgi:hypothetical protein